MALAPLPLPDYPRHQEDLIWRGALAAGDMGLRSIQGAIQARLEGGTGAYGGGSELLLEDPQTALEDLLARASMRAAGRAKRIDAALARCFPEDQRALIAAYWHPPQPGMEAWGALANVVPLSPTARDAYRTHLRQGGSMTFGEWLTRLSVRKVGQLGRDGRRRRPKAGPAEEALVLAIARECEIDLLDSLQNYVEATRRGRG